MRENDDSSGKYNEEEKLQRLKRIFEHIVREQYHQLLRMAGSKSNPNLANDIVQDALLSSWQALKKRSYNELEHFNVGGYIYVAINNICSNPRTYRHDVEISIDDEKIYTFMEGQKPELDKDIEQMPDREALRRAINRLPPNFQKVMQLYYFADLTLKEIAQQMNEKLTTIKTWHVRAKRLLAKIYLEECE